MYREGQIFPVSRLNLQVHNVADSLESNMPIDKVCTEQKLSCFPN